MALALQNTDTVGSPEWWMVQLAKRLLDRRRMHRLAVLDAYLSGCPPMPRATDSERKAYYAFTRLARSNLARTIVRAPAQRMAIRAIRTAAADDESGDAVAWRYWTGSGLDIASTDVHSNMLTFSDGVVRVGLDEDGQPIALRRDPRFIVTAQDPSNPLETIAAFELLWDEWARMDYAYLWLPGRQYVASRPRPNRPSQFLIPGLTESERRWSGFAWWPRLSFDPSAFTMRPDISDIPADERDDEPYSQTYADETLMPVVPFPNRDGVGEFEEHLDLLDRINHTTMIRVVTAAVQAYKQRALQQPSDATADRLPDQNPETGETIDWDEIFEPGPDSLWRLPPGVSIWESSDGQLQPIISAGTEDLKRLAIATETPFSILTPDAVNQSAEGASGGKEMLSFKVEDRQRIAGRQWAKVISTMFKMAPDEDRYDESGNDRADASKIVMDWMPAERSSLQEKAQADGLNKSLSADMAAAKIWGLTADEVAINKAQRAGDSLAAMVAAAGQTPGQQAAPSGS